MQALKAMAYSNEVLRGSSGSAANGAYSMRSSDIRRTGASFRVRYFFPNSGSIFTSAATMKAGIVARQVQMKKCL